MSDDMRAERAAADTAVLLAAVRGLDVSQQLGFALGTLSSTADMFLHVAREHGDLVDEQLQGLISSTGFTASLAVEALESAIEKLPSGITDARPPEWFLTLLVRAVEHAQS